MRHICNVLCRTKQSWRRPHPAPSAQLLDTRPHSDGSNNQTLGICPLQIILSNRPGQPELLIACSLVIVNRILLQPLGDTAEPPVFGCCLKGLGVAGKLHFYIGDNGKQEKNRKGLWQSCPRASYSGALQAVWVPQKGADCYLVLYQECSPLP